jgi:flagellar biosynthesis protein FlhF
MQYKRYEARTLKEALTQIKQELGPNALILSTRSFRKDRGMLSLLGRPWMEVTAAADPIATERKEGSVEERRDNNRSISERLPLQAKVMPRLAFAERLTMEHLLERQTYGSYLYPVLSQLGFSEILLDLLRRLEAQGVESDISLEMLQKIRSSNDSSENPNEQVRALKALRDLLKTQINTVDTPLSGKGKPAVMTMLGPTGVGKTTTLAKLAARFALAQGRRVVLATLDTYRIAAVEQLKIYATIMGLPLEVIRGSSDFARLFKVYSEYDLILLDTAGRSPNNDRHLQDLKEALPTGNHMHNFLLVSATTSSPDMMKIIERFSVVNLTGLIVTKVDESSRFGPVFNVLYTTELPVAYITTGQKVPDDLEVAHVDHLVKRLLAPSALT